MKKDVKSKVAAKNCTQHSSFVPIFLQKRKKNKLEGSTQASYWPALWLAVQKEVISKPKQPSCKKRVRPQKGQDEKRCEIQGGGQEMAVMVG